MSLKLARFVKSEGARYGVFVYFHYCLHNTADFDMGFVDSSIVPFLSILVEFQEAPTCFPNDVNG